MPEMETIIDSLQNAWKGLYGARNVIIGDKLGAAPGEAFVDAETQEKLDALESESLVPPGVIYLPTQYQWRLVKTAAEAHVARHQRLLHQMIQYRQAQLRLMED